MWFLTSNLLLLSVFLLTQSELSNGIIITLPDGKIEGITTNTRSNTTFHSFLSLRYAQPPVDNLRFKLAQPLSPWNDVYNATYEKNICYQVDSNSDVESEDCLFMNVFTPKDLTKNVTADLAVMVNIHGGGFYQGAGYKVQGGAGPNFFMDYGVVLVTFNYRLGMFGFATTGDLLLPGNLGLKDQTFALQWIQNNIAHFGGDPKKVTIFGVSAGGASVSYQLLNPRAKGLFRAAIMESGVALVPWAYQRNQAHITQLTAALIQSKLTIDDLKNNDIIKSNFYMNTTELYNFLRSTSASKIDQASQQIFYNLESTYNFQLSQGFFYAPVLEIEHDDAFITQRQYELFKTGNYNRVPVIVGMCDEESLMIYNNSSMVYDFSVNDKDPVTLVPSDMHLADQNKTTVGQIIKDFHAPNTNFSENYVLGIKYHSTHDFHKGLIKQAELQAPYNDVYFYNFAYSGIMGNNINNRLLGTSNVSHGEEIHYYFTMWYSKDIPDNSDMSYFPPQDRNVHYRIMTLWTNFAKYMNPTPTVESILQNITWPAVNATEFKYMEISEDLKIKTGYPKTKYYEFWEDLFEQYAVPPLDTY